MGKTVTADFGDEPKSARSASAPNDHRRRVASALALAGAGADVCVKVGELSHDDCKVGAYPTELIVQKSEQLGPMINS